MKKHVTSAQIQSFEFFGDLIEEICDTQMCSDTMVENLWSTDILSSSYQLFASSIQILFVSPLLFVSTILSVRTQILVFQTFLISWTKKKNTNS